MLKRILLQILDERQWHRKERNFNGRHDVEEYRHAQYHKFEVVIFVDFVRTFSTR